MKCYIDIENSKTQKVETLCVNIIKYEEEHRNYGRSAQSSLANQGSERCPDKEHQKAHEGKGEFLVDFYVYQFESEGRYRRFPVAPQSGAAGRNRTRHLQGGVEKGALTQEQADAKWNAWKEQKEGKVAAKVEGLKKDSAKKVSEALAAEAKVNAARAEALAKAKAEALAAETAAAEAPAEEAPEAAPEA